MGLPSIDSGERFTYGDYKTWPDDERWELIDGIPYSMSPAPSRTHQEISVSLASQIFDKLIGKPCRIYSAPFDVRLPAPDEADDSTHTVVQPDISVVCDTEKLDDAGCNGAPTFIVEILSPRTAAYDLIEKRQLYERVGVKEYWTIQPTDAVIQVWRLQDGGVYSGPKIYKAEGTLAVEAVNGLVIDLEKLFAWRDEA